ncbi:MAG: hypothetical protein IKF80_08600 [Erysipelotrichaceae bacterium]|nr:hypothetical protein [Erysipelotrichaceae bacterium]
MKKENKLWAYFVICYFAFIFIIYWWNMVAIHTPWYDELYTYAHFISQGPLFVATHWPLPNNHILFNLLSSFVYLITKNNIISLRLISYFFFVLSCLLLYFWLSKDYDKKTGLIASVAFSLCLYTHDLGIQGRGYSLANFLFLTALLSCIRIVQNRNQKGIWFIAWSFSITMAVYDIPSNLYWIMLLYICTIFQIRKDFTAIIKYTFFSFISAAATCVLYLPVWYVLGEYSGMTEPPIPLIGTMSIPVAGAIHSEKETIRKRERCLSAQRRDHQSRLCLLQFRIVFSQ